MKGTLYVIIVAVALALAAGLSFVSERLGYKVGFQAGVDSVPAVEPIRDTIFKCDTIRPKPEIKWRTVTHYEVLPVGDTIRVRDTLWMPVPRESVTYADSTYRAIVSGVRPSLDTIEIYQHTIEITKYVTSQAPRKRWGIGPYVGVGIGRDFGAADPYSLKPNYSFGVSLHYDLLQF